MSVRGRSMGLTAVLMLLLIAIVGTYHFWPSNKDQQITAFFSLLQFFTTIALLALTFSYVVATKQYVEATKQQLSDQNRAPKITVVRHWYETDPFVANFVVEVANPSVRATSIAIKNVRIGDELASEVRVQIGQRTPERVAIPAREIMELWVKATFGGVPIWDEKQKVETALITIDDVFHGTLEPVVHKL